MLSVDKNTIASLCSMAEFELRQTKLFVFSVSLHFNLFLGQRRTALPQALAFGLRSVLALTKTFNQARIF